MGPYDRATSGDPVLPAQSRRDLAVAFPENGEDRMTSRISSVLLVGALRRTVRVTGGDAGRDGYPHSGERYGPCTDQWALAGHMIVSIAPAVFLFAVKP
jgi:hypothetical protein